ncbi:Major facilitator superfamily [Kalmanozyma brasiliensis GHG001]|uniref:Uncharacterized protein n=1 Tax=Kalmanozyma brasiliensis (strain GHG001) TaxID=1365824 RepID=V5EK03_KALBG|nr:Major facilitator superfamily [Kalmanozyma brasiliensis GHG001]EST05170.1 Major facilitator superfamily [Kalmanozyma brasiliensis GHG001]
MGLQLWGAFTPEQRRNIAIYTLGIMCYKFALEYFNGSFITQANERFGARRFEKIAILTGTNYAAQCIGSIIVAPLIKRFPTRSVLACAVLTFGLISTIPLIADAATGGVLKFKTANNRTRYGTWSPNGLFPIYVISGISYGTVELIRRVIPRDIVGGDVNRLRKMDAFVHVMYEVAGTTGAFTSTSLIGKFGYNYSAFLSPVLFTLAACIWIWISSLGESQKSEEESRLARVEVENRGLAMSMLDGVRAFGKAFYYGAYLIFTDRRFIWLVPGYAFALYGHRYLENGLAPIYARGVIGVSSYSQIIVGGSNFGELLGALSVMIFTNAVPSPMPWLRLDALLLNLVWVMPFFPYTRGAVSSAWKLAAVFIPISFGWAAGDVSLAAYIQSTLARMEAKDKDVSALGAVMAFLYVTYIVMYSLISTFLGRWVDRRLRGLSGVAAIERARDSLKYVGGVHFTILSIIIIAATFIPKGSLAFNPKTIDPSLLKNSDEESDTSSQEIKEAKYQERDSFAPQDIQGDAVGALAQNTAARVPSRV